MIETAVLLTATYGLRRSEAIGLKWSAVDFESHTIRIFHTVVGAGNLQVRSDTTKNTSSTRTLPMVPQIEQHLLQLKNERGQMRLMLGNGFDDSGYICTWEDGRLLSPEYVSRKFKATIQSSDLPVYRYHDLRHSSASLLLAAGWSLKEIGAWLGHSSITTTNRYAHLQFRATMDMAQSVTKNLFG